VKHLSPPRLQAAAEGQALRPVERAHLRACAACTAEAEALTALMLALQEAPHPARALDAAVMRRLGLAPQPRRAWRWAPLGLGLAAACALCLTLASPHRQPGVAPAVAPAPAAAAGLSPAPPTAHRTPPPSALSPATAAPAVALTAPPGQGSLEAPVQQGSAPAQGALAPTPQPTRPPEAAEGVKDPAAGVPLPLVASVQGNLLKPGSGPLRVRLQVAQAGPLDARIFDQQGRPVAELFHGSALAGETDLQWDAAGAASGPYSLVIRAQAQAQTVKLLVVR